MDRQFKKISAHFNCRKHNHIANFTKIWYRESCKEDNSYLETFVNCASKVVKLSHLPLKRGNLEVSI